MEIFPRRGFLVGLALAAAAALLWLFMLPGLWISGTRVEVVGCDRVPKDGDDFLCLELFCKKALLSNEAIGSGAQIEIRSSTLDAHGHSTHEGFVYLNGDRSAASRRRVRCDMTGRTVTGAEVSPIE